MPGADVRDCDLEVRTGFAGGGDWTFEYMINSTHRVLVMYTLEMERRREWGGASSFHYH